MYTMNGCKSLLILAAYLLFNILLSFFAVLKARQNNEQCLEGLLVNTCDLCI